MLNFLLSLKDKATLFIFTHILVALLGAMVVGIPVGKLLEKSTSGKLIKVINHEHSVEIAKHIKIESELAANRDKWRLALEQAQQDAISTAKLLEQNNKNLITLTNKIKTVSAAQVVVKEIRNDCKTTDIIVNTDSSDKLRNCFASDNPSACSNL